MKDQWATSRRDLLLALDLSHGRREALERGLREAVREGRLSPGTPLPSTRALARDLGFARGTVTEAYAQLVAEGYLTARQGSGTVVASGASPAVVAPRPPPVRTRLIDFRPGSPDLSSFPRSRWLAAMRRVLHSTPDSALGHGDPRGHPDLRRALAEYLGRARGVRASPDLIVVCNGFAHALSVLCRAMQTVGVTTVAMEDPCLPDHRAIVKAAGASVVSVPVDRDGLRTDLLADHPSGAVIVTPAHQGTLGMTTAPARRSALLAWARDTGGVVIEDDYDGEFRYDRQPVGALQGLDPDRVVYAGTTSKTLAPGVRLSWLAVPAWLLDSVVEVRRLTDRYSGVLDQLALADLIGSGGFDRHIRQMRLRYRRRRNRLVAALTERVPVLRPSGIAAGLQFVLMLPPNGPTEAEALDVLAGRGIALYGLGHFFSNTTQRPAGLIVGYGSPPEHAFAGAMRALVDALADLWPETAA
jgi:GntR family transcriptional regulator/MocR family aminotransferase